MNARHFITPLYTLETKDSFYWSQFRPVRDAAGNEWGETAPLKLDVLHSFDNLDLKPMPEGGSWRNYDTITIDLVGEIVNKDTLVEEGVICVGFTAPLIGGAKLTNLTTKCTGCDVLLEIDHNINLINNTIQVECEAFPIIEPHLRLDVIGFYLTFH